MTSSKTTHVPSWPAHVKWRTCDFHHTNVALIIKAFRRLFAEFTGEARHVLDFVFVLFFNTTHCATGGFFGLSRGNWQRHTWPLQVLNLFVF